MKNILKNKLLIIVSIFIILMIVLASNCLAASYASEDFDIKFFYNGENISIRIYNNQLPSYFDGLRKNVNAQYIYKDGRDGKIYVLYITNPNFDHVARKTRLIDGTSNNFSHVFYCYDKDGKAMGSDTDIGFWFSLNQDEDGKWYRYSHNFSATVFSSGFHTYKGFDTEIIYSTSNVLDLDNGEVVFPLAPLPVEQVTIPEITQVKEIPQMMGKVLEMIIPIGLVILSIGLVIFLMRLVISRLT